MPFDRMMYFYYVFGLYKYLILSASALITTSKPMTSDSLGSCFEREGTAHSVKHQRTCPLCAENIHGRLGL